MSNLINRSNSLSRISICAFYLVTVSFLLLANLDTLKGVTYEGSDFAANSVLIQSAKNFSLWTGNYSRVGFYHPGPAILYVLTAGEVIFHDWFHLVEHPFAGQIIAVSFYNALWITLAFIGFHRLSQSKSIALGALSVLLLTLALMEHSLFNGIWMPYMYVFPFVIAVMAIGRVIDGKTDSLQSLAISSGFLINGHASFIGILGVLLIVSLAGNYLIYRRQPQSERILLSPLFITRHKKSLSLACLMLSLFFIPLVVKTITAFPGPVKEYASFSGGHETNSLANSVTFMASYWGGRLWAVLGLALLALAFLVSPRAPQELRTRVQSLAASLFAATLAILFYARYGIDFLNEKYLGLFYYAVPALTIAYAVIILLSQTRISTLKTLIAVCTLVLLAIIFPVIKKPAGYSEFYDLSNVPSAFETLQTLAPANGLVLDLEITNNWLSVWSYVAGLEAYSVRKGVKIFCINQNWHLLFTKGYRCSAEEVRLGKRLIVTDLNNYPDRLPVLSASWVSMYALEAPAIAKLGKMTVTEAPHLFSNDLLASGWSNREKDMVWSDGKLAHLTFKTAQTSVGSVTLDLQAFLPNAESQQSVSFSLNGKPISTAMFSIQNPRQKISIPVPASDQVQDLQIMIDKPISPKDTGLSADPRQLGVGLFSFEFDEAKQ